MKKLAKDILDLLKCVGAMFVVLYASKYIGFTDYQQGVLVGITLVSSVNYVKR